MGAERNPQKGRLPQSPHPDAGFDWPRRVYPWNRFMEKQPIQNSREDRENDILKQISEALLSPEAEALLPQPPEDHWHRIASGLRQRPPRRLWCPLAAFLAAGTLSFFLLYTSSPSPTMNPEVSEPSLLRGSASTKRIDKVLSYLADPDEDVRTVAVEKLGKEAGEPDRVVPALANLLRDESAQVRGAACEALGQFGQEAKATAPALEQLSTDPDPEVRRLALVALGKIAPARSY